MKWLVLILLFIGCEKDPTDNYICKECTVITNYPEETIKVFACGDELSKLEKSGVKCIKSDFKN